MIGHFPLWVVVFVWLSQRKHEPVVTFGNYSIYTRLIQDMRYTLPFPSSKFDRWLIEKILVWMDSEISNIHLLAEMGVRAVGTVKS